MAIINDLLYEYTCLYGLTDCFSGWKNDRIRIIMESFGLAIFLVLAILYVLRYVKQTLTIGEGGKGCQNCPVANVPPLKKVTSTQKSKSTR